MCVILLCYIYHTFISHTLPHHLCKKHNMPNYATYYAQIDLLIGRNRYAISME